MNVQGYRIVRGFCCAERSDAIAAKKRFESLVTKYRVFRNHKGMYRLGYKVNRGSLNKVLDFLLHSVIQ